MQQEVFKLYSKYYNLFYADKKYDAEVDYVHRVIRKFAPNAKSILEYGSGTGGHGLLLQKKGYDIVGLERSEEMAKIATSKGLRCHVGDIVHFELTTRFDVCIALFHVISYINSNADLIKLFNKTRSNLSPGGIFVFDVWFSPAVVSQRPEVRVKKVEDNEVKVTRLALPVIDDVMNTVLVNYEIFIKNKDNGQVAEVLETHSMRHFGIPEIELLAWQTGFTVLRAEEFLSGEEPSTRTWGVNFILKANSE
jgi:SAM-dependent methyltransferase